MGGQQSTQRVRSTGTFNRLFLAECCVIFFIMLVLLGMLLAYFSSVSLNKCAFEQKLTILLNSNLTDECSLEASGGDTSCVGDAYKEVRWKDFEWYVLYAPLGFGFIVFIVIAIYLTWNAIRLLWWFMALMIVLWLVQIVGAIVVCIIWFIRCKHYDFCARPKYVFDFTGYVKFVRPDWAFIVYFCGLCVIMIGLVGLLAASLFGTQYIASFGAMLQRVADPNRVASSLDGSHKPRKNKEKGSLMSHETE